MEDGSSVLPLLKQSGLKVSTMGRGIEEEKEIFLTLVLQPGPQFTWLKAKTPLFASGLAGCRPI
jgi:hypothetical protein